MITTETDIEWGYTKITPHARGVNKKCKMIITFSHLNSSNFKDNFKDNFMLEKLGRINPIICVIVDFSSSLRSGAFSNCFMMTSFTSLLVTPLVSNAASKLNHWDT